MKSRTDNHRSNALPPRRRIMLASLARSEDSVLKELVPILREAFGADIGIAAVIPLSEDAYDPSRDQYRSSALVEALVRHKQPEWERLLGITDVDLYTMGLNFVFGQADIERSVALFSLARLHADRDRFVQRAATEAIHELAHTYGLTHCKNPRCVMWFSNTLEESDRKGTRFCEAHAQALHRAIVGLTPK